MTEIKPIELHLFAVEYPPKGCKFVAFYNDGSGTGLFARDDEGDYIRCDYQQITSDSGWFEDAGYLYWARLPDDFELWFEYQER